jgi:hypothetical protein
VPCQASRIYTAWVEIDIAEKVAWQPALSFKVPRHEMDEVSCTCDRSTKAKTLVADEDPPWNKVATGE